VSLLSVTSNSGAKPCFLRSADMAHLAERSGGWRRPFAAPARAR
jgi:hypothetical protein